MTAPDAGAVARGPLQIGDEVIKPKGYPFPGTVVGIYTKLNGETRIVVEHRDGWDHIFAPHQLERTARG